MADQPAPQPEEPYQSLYRRFRPQRFADVRGQEHVTRALSNAVRDGRVAHAYLFSGPRGTGKTSTARILAMALNCEHPVDGEPDGVCLSCVEIRRGASMDVQELDAASNRGLEEMKDLLSRVAFGVRGRWKVYIIDEVHQLTPNAASALLKTLEEPPAHVVFVLATTDPQKVLPTIRSRTQHFEFHLLGPAVLGDLLHSVNERAGLGVAPEAIDLVVRRGHGSARDALTVLDQVAASASDVEDVATVVAEIVDGLADRDPGRVLLAVAEGMSAGRDARRLAADIVEHLRNGFMATMARSLVMLPDDALAEVEEQARRLGPGALVRAMDGVGQALTDMRDSVDPRVTLEVALVRLARPDLDTSPAGLLERIERLERASAKGGDGGDATTDHRTRPAAVVARPEPSVPPAPPPRPQPSGPGEAGGRDPGPPPPLPPRERPPDPSPPPAARAEAVTAEPAPASERQGPRGGATRSAPRAGGPPRVPSAGAARPAPTAGAAPPAPAAGGSSRPAGDAAPAPAGGSSRSAGDGLPSRDELTKAWGDGVLRGLSGRAKAYLGSGRFIEVDDRGAVFAVPDKHLLSRGESLVGEAQAALSAHFGRPVPFQLVLDPGAKPIELQEPAESAEEPSADDYDLTDLEDAPPAVASPEQRLLDAFPGAEEVST